MHKILKMAKNVGKGWFAIILGKYITFETLIPEYILNALVFAKAEFGIETISNIVKYRIKNCNTLEEYDIDKEKSERIITDFRNGSIDNQKLIYEVKNLLPDDQVISFLEKID